MVINMCIDTQGHIGAHKGKFEHSFLMCGVCLNLAVAQSEQVASLYAPLDLNARCNLTWLHHAHLIQDFNSTAPPAPLALHALCRRGWFALCSLLCLATLGLHALLTQDFNNEAHLTSVRHIRIEEEWQAMLPVAFVTSACTLLSVPVGSLC